MFFIVYTITCNLDCFAECLNCLNCDENVLEELSIKYNWVLDQSMCQKQHRVIGRPLTSPLQSDYMDQDEDK